jgi:hypothetical protein
MLLWSLFLIALSTPQTVQHDLGLLGDLDLNCLGGLRLRHEANEPLPLLAKGVAILLRQRLKRLDYERRSPTSSLQLPCSLDKAVNEHGGRDHAVTGGGCLTVVVGDDAGAISVRQDQVVKLGQEAWWGRGISGSSRGASGRSNSSLPCSSRKAQISSKSGGDKARGYICHRRVPPKGV